MSELVKEIKFSERVLELRINRPEALNAMNAEVISVLHSKLKCLKEEFQASKAAVEFREDFPKLIIFTGEGEKAFVAGADLQALASPNGGEFLESGIELMEEIEELPIPTAAVISGFCLGGGLELALSCDVIFATAESQLGLPEITLGIIPGFGGTQRLSRRTGIGTARRLIFTGERIKAEEALRLGIVDQILSKEGSELTGFCERIKKLSPLALESAKKALFAADSESKGEGLNIERDLFLHLLLTEDAKEGMKAFFEKRPAVFLGK